jgi:hypothetical protein
MKPRKNRNHLTQGFGNPTWLLPAMHNALRFIRRECNLQAQGCFTQILA